VLPSYFSHARSSKRALQGEYKGYAKFMKHLNSCGRIFALWHRKQAILKVEVVKLLRKDHWEHRWMHVHVTSLAWCPHLCLITILENIFLDRMAMEINVKEELFVFCFL